MHYVVVNARTRCIVVHRNTGQEFYRTESAAKAARTRFVRGGEQDPLAVMDVPAYRAQVPMKTVTNLMTGLPVEIPVDTPISCDPSSETYWSM